MQCQMAELALEALLEMESAIVGHRNGAEETVHGWVRVSFVLLGSSLLIFAIHTYNEYMRLP